MSPSLVCRWLANEFFTVDTAYDKNKVTANGEIVGTQKGLDYHEAHDLIFELFRIDTFVEDIMASDQLAFTWMVHDSDSPHWEAPSLGKHWETLPLGEHILRINDFRLNLPGYYYSEYASVFFACGDILDLTHESMNMRHRITSPEARKRIFAGNQVPRTASYLYAGEKFNDLITCIRSEIKKPQPKPTMSIRRKRIKEVAKANLESLSGYFLDLLGKYKALQVVNIDLGYQQITGSPISVDRVYADLELLANKRRSNKIFKNVVGYIWRFEHTEQQGHHLHMFLFCTMENNQHDRFLLSEIGTYWVQKITKNQGTYFNCENSHRECKYLGFDVIHCTDIDKRQQLLNHLIYMTTKDQYLRLFKLPERRHSVGRGRL